MFSLVSTSTRPLGGPHVRSILLCLDLRFHLILACGLASLFGCEVARAQFGGLDAGPHGTIEVHLRGGDANVVSAAARIRLLSTAGPEVLEGSVDGSGTARFDSLQPGTYIVEASAPGFLPARETVELEMKWSSANVYLSLKPANNGTSTSTASSAPSVPILAPKAQKELDAGVEAFRGKDMVQARKHFEKALSMAPGNADVQYLMGALELQEKNIPAGQEHLEKAVQLFPNHVRALELLGELYCSQGHPERAVPLLEKAVSLDEVSWKAHWKLGSAYLQSNDPAKAQQQSERAIALGKGEAGVAQVLDAAALADLGKLDAAESVLEAFVRDQPNDPAAPPARIVLAELKHREKGAQQESSLPFNQPKSVAAVFDLQPEISTSKTSTWSEPGIDERVPGVAPNVSCALPQVLAGAGKQVELLMDSLEKIEATERVEHFTIDKQGELRSPEVRSFDYVVAVVHQPHGVIELEEYRNGSLDPHEFPADIATEGLPAMALIFHPQISSDFDFTCEGLGQASGRPAWQVHFQQNPKRPNRIRAYVIARNYYPVPLKGRAWIDATSYQIVRLESELVNPMPQIRLARERVSIDYAPVQFRSKNVQMWLPSHAELRVAWNKNTFYRTHAFSNFKLFSVGTDQKIGAPKESYSFTNLSDQDVWGRLTVLPVPGHSLAPISVTFVIPARASVNKAVGPGQDVNISAELIVAAQLAYSGAPGAILGNATLTSGSILEVVSESENTAAP